MVSGFLQDKDGLSQEYPRQAQPDSGELKTFISPSWALTAAHISTHLLWDCTVDFLLTAFSYQIFIHLSVKSHSRELYTKVSESPYRGHRWVKHQIKYSAPYCLEIGSLTKWEVHCWLSWLAREFLGSPCLFLPGLAQWMPGFLCEWQGFSFSAVNNSVVKEFSS